MSVTPEPALPEVDPRVVGQRIKHERQERGADPGPARRGASAARAPHLSLLENGHREPKLRLLGGGGPGAGRPGRAAAAARAAEPAGRPGAGPGARPSRPALRRARPAAAAGQRPGAHRRRSSTSSACTTSCAAGPSGCAATPEEARAANRELRADMRARDNYFADIERLAAETLDAVGYPGTGALTQRHAAGASPRTAASPCATSRTCRRRPGRSPTSATAASTSARAAGRRSRHPQRAAADARALRCSGTASRADFAELLRQRTEANYFAAAVLMPEQALVPLLQRAKADRALAVEDARDVFGVSYEMAAHRFTNLATQHLELPVHFVRTDEAGTHLQGVRERRGGLPGRPGRGDRGAAACRFWAAPPGVLGRALPRLLPVHRHPAGDLLLLEPAGDPAGAGRSRSPSGCRTCSRAGSAGGTPRPAPSRAAPTRPAAPTRRHRWPGAGSGWPGRPPRAQSHVLAALPPGAFAGVDLTEVYAFLDRHATGDGR